MTNFTTGLSNIIVSCSENGVTMPDGFQDITGSELLAKLSKIQAGSKDGSHFLRTSLLHNDKNKCLSRSDANTSSLANLLIIDCDKRVDINTGEELDGAPDPYKISSILRSHSIGHVLYGSYSNYVGDKGNRYRIIIITDKSYSKSQLAPTIESIIALINTSLDNELLVNANENHVWSQPWYYPRKPNNSIIEELYIEYLEGNTVSVSEPITLPPIQTAANPKISLKNGEISPIDAFNNQYPITGLLKQYGYKHTHSTNDYQKWIRPDSSSGNAGITVKDNKIYSHHNDKLNDGYWHDAFDLMKISESLTENEAITRAASITFAPDGRTVDKYNKSLVKINGKSRLTTETEPKKILKQLLKEIPHINFRKKVGLSNDSDELLRRHFYITAIEVVLETAKKYNWGMCRNHDFIYLYNGSHWCLIDEDDLKVFLGIASEKMGMDRYYARDYKFRDELYKQFITQAHLPKPDYPKNTILINLKNGTFEITPDKRQLRPFDEADFLTYQLPFSYDPNATCPIFQAYLDKVLPDKQLQNILAEYLGYIFIRTSTLKLEKALILYGNGANGKSVFYEVTRSLLGENNTSEYSLQSLTDDKGYQRAMIANKLLNYASELSCKLETYIFKQLVSGEPVEARLPYGRPFSITDYAKLIFNCNELPNDVEHTEAYFRRFLIVPFNVTIDEKDQDKQLAKKIIDAELSGVFNWVLNGLNRLLEQKQFTDSNVIREAREEYEKESDSVQLFLDEAGYKSSIENPIPIKQLYKEYKLYCQDYSYHIITMQKFKKRLARAKITIDKRNVGNVAFLTKDDIYNRAKWGE